MSTPRIRLVRPVPDPPGLFIRAGRIAQEDLQSFITARAAAFTGVVFEAKRVEQQKELLLRPSQFLEELVRPASDTAVKVSTLDLPSDLTKKLHKQMKRLNGLRTTLGPYARQRRDASFAMHPIARIARAGGRK